MQPKYLKSVLFFEKYMYTLFCIIVYLCCKNNNILYLIPGVTLSFLLGLVHTYKISDDGGSGRSHSGRRTEHSEECVRGPDGKGRETS